MGSVAELARPGAHLSDTAPPDRRELEVELRRAFAKGEFAVVYQPMVSLSDSRITGCEALLRWHHPVRGLLLPGAFLTVVEDIGLMPAVGRWLLREALAEARAWPSAVKVAVNISGTQLLRGDLAQSVSRLLVANGLAPGRLELEFTETISPLADGFLLRELNRLRKIGVCLAIDDFGSGYSSLDRLQRFAFDKIKIDRSLMSGFPDRAECRAIMRAIVALAAELGMTTTAEGGETWTQVAMLRMLGCTEVQGFFYYPACSSGEIREILGRV